jgi:hypothetical protein
MSGPRANEQHGACSKRGLVLNNGAVVLLGRPASGYCLCNGHRLGRRPLPVTAACDGRPLSETAAVRRHRRRPFPVTAALLAAPRFM